MKILAFDIGTSSVRAAVYNPYGAFVGTRFAQVEVDVLRPRPGAALVDPLAIRDMVVSIITRAPSDLLPYGEDFLVTISGFWHSLMGIDGDGMPLTPCWIWEDALADGEARELAQGAMADRIPDLTGCPVAPTFWPARLRHHLVDGRYLGRKVALWVSLPEWIFQQFFGGSDGGLLASPSMAAGTGLLDRRTLDWAPEMLELAGITTENLPPVNSTPIEFEYRNAKGLLIPVLGDGAAGTFGSGIRPGDHTLAVNFGTSAAVRRMGSQPIERIPTGLFEYRLDAARTILGGAVNNAGNLFEWARETLRVPDDPATLEAALAARPEPIEDLTVLPFWAGERTPHWEGDLRGSIAGLNLKHTPLDLLQAIQEATFYSLRSIGDALDPDLVCDVVVSGGMTRSPASLQRFAHIMGRPLAVLEEQEVSLFGAVLYAAEFAGLKTPVSRRGQVYLPDPELVKRYAAVQERYAATADRYVQGMGRN